MRALTVQQPWAWAIIHGGKTIENRTQAWKYRGPLAIHSGARVSERGGMIVPDLVNATRPGLIDSYTDGVLLVRAIIGVVQLVDVHTAFPGCCDSPWAEQHYEEHGGTTRRDIVHMVLEDPQPIDPIPCKGRLGLWTPPVDVAAQLAP